MLLLLCLLALSSSSVVKAPKCIITAPYLVAQPLTQLAIDKVVKEGQAWYQNELTTFVENANLLSASDRAVALDRLMSVFCTGSKFKGFIGITPVPELFTNRTVVAGLYDSFPSGTDVTFNADAYDGIVTIVGGNLREVHANMTGRFQLIAKGDSFGLSLFLGHYQNEWIVNEKGDVCISRFHDSVSKWFLLDGTELLSVPSDF